MKSRYRPLLKRIEDTKIKRQWLFVVGAILFIQIISFDNASALSLKQSSMNIGKMNINSSKITNLIKEKENVIKKRSESIKIAEEKYEKEIESLKEIRDTKESIKEEIIKIKKEIEEKKDLFVNPVKYASDAAGNAYALGNCTWYVKQKRPDIGNFWGNANNWINSAKAQGFATGTKAKVGAIGVSFEGWAGHVVYVEKIGKGVVHISEMNYAGQFNSVNKRTVPESDFQYVYAMI